MLVQKYYEVNPLALQQNAAIATGLLFGGGDMAELLNIHVGAQDTFKPDEYISALKKCARAILKVSANIQSREKPLAKEFLEERHSKDNLLTCAACGMRQREKYGKFGRIPLRKALALSVNAELEDDYKRLLRIGSAYGQYQCEKEVLNRTPATGSFDLRSTYCLKNYARAFSMFISLDFDTFWTNELGIIFAGRSVGTRIEKRGKDESIQEYWHRVTEVLLRDGKCLEEQWKNISEWIDNPNEIFTALRYNPNEVHREVHAYWLHPEFVDHTHTVNDPLAFRHRNDGKPEVRQEPSTILCGSCLRVVSSITTEEEALSSPASWKTARPLMSVASGLDFGDARRLGLVPLTPLEVASIAHSRPYMLLYKFSGANAGRGVQPVLRGHCISFSQEGASAKVNDAFILNASLHETVSITFVGPAKQLEKRMQAALPFGETLRAPNFNALLQYLRFFQAIQRDDAYTNLKLPRPGDNFSDWKNLKEYYTGDPSMNGTFLNRVFEGISVVEDRTVVAVDVVSTSADPSAAQQQATAVHGDDDADVSADSITVIEDVCLSRANECAIHNESHEKGTASLEAMRAMFPKNVEISREQCAQSDYEELNKEIADGNPTLFLLGIAPKGMGALSTAQSRHVLLQFNPSFGSCATLIFMLFNQLRRASVSRSVAGEVRNNTESFRVFNELVQDENILEKIELALKDPTTPEARLLMRKIDRTILVAGRNTPFSGAARRSKKGDFIAQLRFCASFNFFNTISPAPTGSLLAMRATFESHDNRSFPAKDEGFLEAVIKGDTFQVPGRNDRPQSEFNVFPSELLRRATQNTVPTAEEYRLDIEAHYAKVLQHPTEAHARKNRELLNDDAIGAFGATAAGCGVTEQNGKGFSHNHSLASAGVPAWAIEAISGATVLDGRSASTETYERYNVALKMAHAALGEYIDTCTSAQLDAKAHLQALLGSYCCFLGYVSQHNVLRAAEPGDNFNEHVAHTVMRTGVHSVHGTRCRKGKIGQEQCSQGYPQPLNSSCPRLLLLNGQEIPGPLPTRNASAARSFGEFTSPLNVDGRILLNKPSRQIIDATAVLKEVAAAPLLKAHSTPVSPEDTAYGSVIEARKWFVLKAAADDAAVLDTALVDLHQAQKQGHLVSDSCLHTLIARLPQEYQLKHLPGALTKRNGRVTDYNRLISGIWGCNTAIYNLGCGQAQLTALFYTIDYVTKSSMELENALSLVANARRHVDDYPSVAEDSGTQKRTAQHLGNRILNSANGLEEISQMQASGVLLGDKPEQSTHKSVHLNVGISLHLCTPLMVQLHGPQCVAPSFTDPESAKNEESTNSDESTNENSSDSESDSGDATLNPPLGSFDGTSRTRRAAAESNEGTVKPDVVAGKPVLACILEA